MSGWQRVDPRLHLAAAIGWAVFAVVTVAALGAANLAASEAESRVRADSERLLSQFATQIHHALAMHIETRRAIVQATAAQIQASTDRSNVALRRHLDAVQAQFPEFAWLGVADEQGHVTAAAGGALEGTQVSALPWFKAGRSGPYLGGVRPVQVAAGASPPGAASGVAGGAASGVANSASPRVIDIAVPLASAVAGQGGALGAHLSWAWIEHLDNELLNSLDSHRVLNLLLAADDGTVLIGPPQWLGRALPPANELSQQGAYLIGSHGDHDPQDLSFGSAVVVRQDALTALAPARATWRHVFFSVLLAGLGAAAVAVWATRLLMRRLAALAAQARGVRNGALQALNVTTGRDEVSRIGATLAEVVTHLQQEKRALQTLNAQLDKRVAERTARIERMADDARHAAVARERLRLARDLHDTLAHSLMALLTQIRLVRKLRTRWPETELEAELARAEEVAASGLTEARAAITQMRHNGVRESGLGPSLQELLARLSERTGMETTLQAEPAAAELANERAETVYRIAEEALHNVERHAHAQHLTLRLSTARGSGAGSGSASASGPEAALGSGPAETDADADADADAAQRYALEITDDGAGFDPTTPRPGHYGLRGIEEQAALIGARLEVRSHPGQGTRIVVEFDA